MSASSLFVAGQQVIDTRYISPLNNTLDANGQTISNAAALSATEIRTEQIALPAGSLETKIAIDNSIEVAGSIKATAIPSATFANVLGYNPTNGTISYQPAGGGGGPYLALSGGTMDPSPNGVIKAHTIEEVNTIRGSTIPSSVDTTIETVNGNDLIISTGAGDEIDINTGALLIDSTIRTEITAVPNVTRLLVDAADGVLIKSKKASPPTAPYIDYTTDIDSGPLPYPAMRFNSQKAGGTQNKSLVLKMTDGNPTWESSWEGYVWSDITTKCENFNVEGVSVQLKSNSDVASINIDPAIGTGVGTISVNTAAAEMKIDASGVDLVLQTDASAYLKTSNTAANILLQVDGECEATFGGSQLLVASTSSGGPLGGNAVVRIQGAGAKGGEITTDEINGEFVFQGKNGLTTAIKSATEPIVIRAADASPGVVTVECLDNTTGGMTSGNSGKLELQPASATLSAYDNAIPTSATLTVSGNEISLTTNAGGNSLKQSGNATEIVGNSTITGPATLVFNDTAGSGFSTNLNYVDIGAGRPSLFATGHFLGTSIGASQGFTIGHDSFGTSTNCAFGNDGIPTRISHSQTALATDFIELSSGQINTTAETVVGISTTNLASSIGFTAGPAGANIDIVANGDDTGKVEIIAQTGGSPMKIALDGATSDLILDNVPTASGNVHQVTFHAISNGLTVNNWLKVLYNGSYIWIPYLTTDPSL